jgi:hypothetical protein
VNNVSVTLAPFLHSPLLALLSCPVREYGHIK